MTDRRPAVYGASTLAFAPMWRELRQSRRDIRWTARWPDIQGKVSESDKNAAMFWLHNIADIRSADCVLVVPPPTGVLRGALIEAGVALGMGKPVCLVGDCASYGSWKNHPSVFGFPHIEAACGFITGDWS